MGEQLPDAMTHFCTHEGKLLVLLHHHFNTPSPSLFLFIKHTSLRKSQQIHGSTPPPLPRQHRCAFKAVFFIYLCAFFDLTSMTTMALRMCVNLICSFMCG